MSAKCKICSKGVYPMDPQINLDGSKFHKACAKCADCRCQITLTNFAKNESGDQTLLLCKVHYFKRFHEGGSYIGGDKYQNKTSSEKKLASPTPSTSSPTPSTSSPTPSTSYPTPSPSSPTPSTSSPTPSTSTPITAVAEVTSEIDTLPQTVFKDLVPVETPMHRVDSAEMVDVNPSVVGPTNVGSEVEVEG